MVEEKKNIPKVRFREFAGDDANAWEQRKLREVANHRGGTAIEKYFDKNGQYKVISIGSYGLDGKYIDQNIRAISNKITDERVVHAGELTMVLNDKTANGTIIGRSLLIEQDNKYVVNQRTEIIAPKVIFDSKFAFTILNGSFREKVKRIIQGGTQIYVNYSAVENLSIELPDIEEQQKIGDFFKHLDELITLHQRELDNYKMLKKTMLSKMFPKNDEKYPEIRFTGFAYAWELRKLGNISKTKRGLTYKPSNIDNTGIRVLRSSNIKEDTFVISDDDVFVKESAVNIPFVENGDILITAANGSTNLVGKHAIIRDIPKNSAVHGGFMLITTSKEYEFLNALMSSNWYKKFIKKYVVGGNGAIGNLRKNDLDNQKIYVPKKDEQKKIGNFFKMLDSLITLHQRELESLKTLKKNLLQQMFV